MGTLWTVVETPSYLSRAEKIFSASERAEIVTMLASDPECGEIMQGTGGVRKVRVAVGGRGKSGGARVIYYFHGSESLPILIFAVFTKNEKANLSDTEKNNLAKLTQAIKARAKWRNRRKGQHHGEQGISSYRSWDEGCDRVPRW